MTEKLNDKCPTQDCPNFIEDNNAEICSECEVKEKPTELSFAEMMWKFGTR